MSRQRFNKELIPRLSSIEFWKALNPELTITERPFLRKAPGLNVDDSLDQKQYVNQMKQEGYINLDGILSEERMELMAQAITRLIDEGFPAVLCYVYDEFWQVFRDIAPVVSPIFGENYRLSINRWAWYIPATEDNAGFEPHRDMPNYPYPLVRADGLPVIATVWIPLSEVAVSNACMHVLPINHDPNATGSIKDTAISHKCLQSIRALPGRAGSIMSWNANVLHWGSRSSSWMKKPRISIATYLIRSEDTNFTSINIEPYQLMTFDSRLGVIGQAISHYNNETLNNECYSPELIEFLENYKFCEPNEWRFPQANVIVDKK